jgi:hypothetical protein
MHIETGRLQLFCKCVWDSEAVEQLEVLNGCTQHLRNHAQRGSGSLHPAPKARVDIAVGVGPHSLLEVAIAPAAPMPP